MSVHQTILQQLGGNKFLAMTGAKTLMDHGKGLSFKLPSVSKPLMGKKTNYVKIMLTPDDLYTVTFGYQRGMNYVELEVVEGVYADNLRRLFTDKTGLYLSL